MNVYSKAAACPVCEATSAFIIDHPDAAMYYCSQCTHRFSKVRVAEEYDASYFDDRHKRWFQHPNVRVFEKIAAALPKEGQLLDLGCGRGDLLRYLKRRTLSTLSLTGIDVAPNALDWDITFIQGDLETHYFEHQYDVVVSLAVIEHLRDVRAFIKHVSALTRGGGTIVISTVNDRSLLFRLARGLNLIGLSSAFNRLYSKHHLNHFTTHSLRLLLESANIRVKETIVHNAPFAAIDVPAPEFLFRAAMLGICAAGSLTGTSYLQTVIGEKL
jgi:2-polyprenyl-3-methyl-5-hydroxy-6-metoxy-1,4-benzoquinol methylase